MNTTTLNMTTLDGGVIIKKGGGGGATINNQDKVVDITENGTTEVVADGGFTGLGKVTINTEVSGGGADLEGEYYLVKPNGWYWRFTDDFFSKSLNDQSQITMFVVFESINDRGFGSAKQNHRFSTRDIGTLQCAANNAIEIESPLKGWKAFQEGDNNEDFYGNVCNSVYEMVNSANPMTEEEFEGMIQTSMGIQRITKEEYEALITD